MRAVGITAFGGSDRIEVLDVPEPAVGPREVGIRVHAAGVNPVDWKIREGLLAQRIPHRFPLVLGWEAAGVVVEVGSEVTRLSPGDAVWTCWRKSPLQEGAYAERLTAAEEAVSLMPRSLGFTQAAAIPLAALTAWQALVDSARLRAGETVVVDRAAGGVGHFAVQIAAGLGARVVALASPRNHDWLRSLGATDVIDYGGDLARETRALAPDGVHVHFDMHGGERMRGALAWVRDEGRLVGIVEPPEGSAFAERGIRSTYVFVAPNGAQLDLLARRVEEGKLAVHLDDVFALERAALAHDRIETGRVRGKLVLAVRETRGKSAP